MRKVSAIKVETIYVQGWSAPIHNDNDILLSGIFENPYQNRSPPPKLKEMWHMTPISNSFSDLTKYYKKVLTLKRTKKKNGYRFQP